MNQLIEPVLTKMYWLESSENYKRLLKVKDHSRSFQNADEMWTVQK